MSIKVNLIADIPLELFSAIRHGSFDGEESQGIATAGAIAIKALFDGVKTAQPT